MEGIETLPVEQYSAVTQPVSVGAPTWRGLKHPTKGTNHFTVCVSRCPDMEGIETIGDFWAWSISIMSVGAPTWRGLKPLETAPP